MARSKRELAPQGERRVQRQGKEERARVRWQVGKEQPREGAVIPPVRCWEQSAFWVSVAVGMLLLAFVVVGIGGFCHYVKEKEGNGGRIGAFSAAASRVCLAVGFPDWQRPVWGGLWGDEETLANTESAPEESTAFLETDADTESEAATDTESESEIDGCTETESDTETQTDTETEFQIESAFETEAPAYVGNRPVAVQDVSYGDRGATYIENRTDWTPDVAAVVQAVRRHLEGKAVLIVTSHPQDVYRDGGSMDELATVLTEALRVQGITTVYLPVEGDSYLDTQEATAEAIRYYTALLPDVGLVLDLRRSSELTVTGAVLATDGQWAGGRCAQIRLTVDGDGGHRSLCLGAALCLREALWNMEPSVSRPVLVRDGEGLSTAVDKAVVVLTAELGSFGNRYAEVSCSVPILARAVASMCANLK